MEDKEGNETVPEKKQELNQASSKTLREEINELKTKLNDIGLKKEEWFKKKEDLKQEIAKLISKIKEARTNKDSVDVKIKELKENRDKFNKEVRELITKVKSLNPKSPSEKRENPEFFKMQIDKLNTALETQAFDFEKEKKVMKQINDLKKKYAHSLEAHSAQGEMRDLSKRIEEAKKKADEFHNQLKEYLKEHKESNFGRLSKEINQIKKIQEEAFANFIKFKQEFSVINKQLKDKLDMLKTEHQKHEHKKQEKVRDKRDKEQEQIRDKAKEVKEKFKQKKILTTEDLITLQGEPIDTEDF